MSARLSSSCATRHVADTPLWCIAAYGSGEEIDMDIALTIPTDLRKGDHRSVYRVDGYATQRPSPATLFPVRLGEISVWFTVAPAPFTSTYDKQCHPPARTRAPTYYLLCSLNTNHHRRSSVSLAPASSQWRRRGGDTLARSLACMSFWPLRREAWRGGGDGRRVQIVCRAAGWWDGAV